MLIIRLSEDTTQILKLFWGTQFFSEFSTPTMLWSNINALMIWIARTVALIFEVQTEFHQIFVGGKIQDSCACAFPIDQKSSGCIYPIQLKSWTVLILELRSHVSQSLFPITCRDFKLKTSSPGSYLKAWTIFWTSCCETLHNPWVEMLKVQVVLILWGCSCSRSVA